VSDDFPYLLTIPSLPDFVGDNISCFCTITELSYAITNGHAIHLLAWFPETLYTSQMDAQTDLSSDRVRRHRAKRSLIRVEVEVPTNDDAEAIRLFAALRRQNAAGNPTSASVDPTLPLARLIGMLDEPSQTIVAAFAASLIRTDSVAIRSRAARMTLTLADAAERITPR
jgi:hypothetical protein